MNKDELLALLEHRENPPLLPTGLPLNKEQQQWLGGFLTGLKVQVDALGFSAPVGKPITIIYGTQTGNAEAMANEAANVAKKNGLAPQVLDMGDIDLATLAQTERILVVTSTYGEGEMPDNAQVLWDDITSDSAPRFEGSYFSVLALGDTSYDGFCEAGIQWDKRLEQLGAQRVLDRVDCDVDYEAPSMEWIEKVIPIIAEKGSESTATLSRHEDQPGPAKPKFDKKNPLAARLTRKETLSKSGSTKEIVHYEFSLGDSGETYLAGDALNIIPQNKPELIKVLLSLFNKEKVSAKTMHRLKHELEVRIPSKELVQLVGTQTNDDHFKQILADNDTKAITNFLWGLDSYELIKSYGNGQIKWGDFLATCKPLAPRAYSISSSIKKHENEVHLTVSSVRYEKAGRQQEGVASTFLADMCDLGDEVLCYFSPNKSFKIPENGDLPIIMVGPGTGVAPFRAFLEEREANGDQGDNWLFFGDRNEAYDYIYQAEIAAMQQSGLLTRLDLAFSRDQAEKIYIQYRMLEKGAILYEWLERGGYFFVCGDAYRMAKDVDATLHRVIEIHGNTTPEGAKAYVNALKKQKRYVRVVY
ncbi:MAG: sulfite reductase flavoprotein subunit alpha [Bacteroidota bacterium]